MPKVRQEKVNQLIRTLDSRHSMPTEAKDTVDESVGDVLIRKEN